jgi:tetratricopeptide (TPR) repeat protein
VQKEDTNKVLALSGLAFALYSSNPDTTILLAQQAEELALKQGWPKGVANAYNIQGIAYSVKGDYVKGLGYYDKALRLYEEQHNKVGAARVLGNMGLDYSFQSDYTKALEYDLKGLKIVEALGNKRLVANALGNIGLLYNYQKDYDKALEYGTRALDMWKETGNKHGELISINVIGNAYFGKLDYGPALKYYQDALVLAKELADKRAEAINMGNIGNIYYGKGILAKKQHKKAECDSLYKEALNYDLDALKIEQEMGNKESQGNTLSNIGSIYLENKEFKEAEVYLKEAIVVDSIAGALDNLKEPETYMSQLYEETGRPVLALEYYKRAMAIKDSLFNIDKNKALTKKELTYEFEKQQAAAKAEQDKKDALALADKRKQQIVIWSTIGGLLLVLVFAGFILRSLRITRKQKQVIEVKNKETEEQKKVIEEKNKDIIDSINYAKRLQDAILPPLSLVQKYLPQSFVLYKPKDIVAGDFYWMEKAGDSILIAACDCTGHGVPGAMVSVVCSNALNRTVKEFKITEPGKILDKVRELVLETFEKSENNVQDGMDISLCSITPLTPGEGVNWVRLQWSGAYNSLWYIPSSKGEGQGEVVEVPADKQPIGKTDNAKPFTLHTLNLNKGDCVYLFTDGYADQFGGPNGKKFKYKQLHDLLLANSKKAMDEQKIIIESTINEWKGKLEQVDDILIMGIRV